MSFYSAIEKIIEKKSILIIASVLLCFGFLGAHDLWTQENRWAGIVSMMFFRHDFLHPYLGSVPYYDKPLLSYWFIAAVAAITQELSVLTVRLPSASAALLGLFSAYWIAAKCYDKKTAHLFAWMLLSSFFYIFWARTASADIFNVAGSLLAVAIYLSNREHAKFTHFLQFFTVVALTSLCKGIVAAVIVLIVVGIDVLLRGTLKRYLSLSVMPACLCGVVLFCIPFLLSAYYPDTNFVSNNNSGLYLVYKENIVRFFKPFDHKDPFYSYFIYLPIYLLPWIILFVPALFNRIKCWSTLNVTSRWVLLSFIALFVFFTISGSRRSYYILPVVPFALLVIVDWLQSATSFLKPAKIIAIVSTIFYVLFFSMLQPYYYRHYGLHAFVHEALATTQREPLAKEEIALFGVRNQIAFYVGVPPSAILESPQQIEESVLKYAALYVRSQSKEHLPKLILVDKQYVPYIKSQLPNVYHVTLIPKQMRFNNKFINDHDGIVALIR